MTYVRSTILKDSANTLPYGDFADVQRQLVINRLICAHMRGELAFFRRILVVKLVVLGTFNVLFYERSCLGAPDAIRAQS